MVDKILKSFLPDWDGRAILRWSDLLWEFSKIWKKGNLGKERGTHKFHRYIDSFWETFAPLLGIFSTVLALKPYQIGVILLPLFINYLLRNSFPIFWSLCVVTFALLLLFLSTVTSIPKTRFSETFIQTGQSPQFF